MNQNTLSIVKIGGNIVDNSSDLQLFLSDFHRMKGLKMLVHGGGVMATKMAEQLGIETRKIEGRRVTDSETLKVVAMVYAGWLNKQIVALLQQIGCNAVGLSGVDANCIPSVRRPPHPVDFGFVGDPHPDAINIGFISQLLESGITPVFCSITHDEKGSLLNTNADTIAYSLATALSIKYRITLCYCFEKEGVLKDINDSQSLISSVSKLEFETLKREGIVSDGMIPKLENSFRAIENGVSEVIVMHAKNLLSKRGTALML